MAMGIFSLALVGAAVFWSPHIDSSTWRAIVRWGGGILGAFGFIGAINAATTGLRTSKSWAVKKSEQRSASGKEKRPLVPATQPALNKEERPKGETVAIDVSTAKRVGQLLSRYSAEEEEIYQLFKGLSRVESNLLADAEALLNAPPAASTGDKVIVARAVIERACGMLADLSEDAKMIGALEVANEFDNHVNNLRLALEQRTVALIDNEDGTLTDTKAGLMWQKDDDGVQRSQQEAFDYCANLSLAGFTDWRLPKLSEFSRLGAAGGNTRSPRGGFDSEYWTATDPPQNWRIPKEVEGTVAFTSEGVTFGKTNKFYVRCVRGPVVVEKEGADEKAVQRKYVVAFDTGSGRNQFLLESAQGPVALEYYGKATFYSTRTEALKKVDLVKSKFRPESIQIYHLSDWDLPGDFGVDRKETVLGPTLDVTYVKDW